MILLFDFDGTIADSLDTTFETFNSIAGSLGMSTVDPEQIELFRSMSAHQMLKMFKISKFRIPALLIRMRKALAESTGKIDLIKNMGHVLCTLRQNGCLTGIVTSNSEQNVRAFCARHNIEPFAFGHYSSGFFSKARDIRSVVRAVKIKKTTVFYIGDTPEDITAGKKAGVFSVGVTWGYASSERIRKAKPDYIADYPEELLDIFKSRNDLNG